jgi:vancomycin resistance protein VanJ
MNQPVSTDTAVPAPATAPRSRWRQFIAICSWAYLTATVLLALLLLLADVWWPATILMFSPRWVFALPLGLLIPLALIWRRRSLLILLVASMVVTGQVMGFNVPWQRLTESTPTGAPLSVVTLNMHYSKYDPDSLEAFIADTQPDVVAIQEWRGWEKSRLAKLPGWHVHGTPELFLASRHPIKSIVNLGKDSMSKTGAVARYEIDTPTGIVHVINLHLATIRDGISGTIHDNPYGPAEVRGNAVLRRTQCEYVARCAAECKGPVLIVGDFNTPPESPILREVLGEYTDAFDAAGWGWGYTFRAAKTMVRIDHILTGKGWRSLDCRIGPFVGSPHRPVIADLVWTER